MRGGGEEGERGSGAEREGRESNRERLGYSVFQKGQKDLREKIKGGGGAGLVGYWKMNGLEDKCMQARAGRPPLYTAPLP